MRLGWTSVKVDGLPVVERGLPVMAPKGNVLQVVLAAEEMKALGIRETASMVCQAPAAAEGPPRTTTTVNSAAMVDLVLSSSGTNYLEFSCRRFLKL
jgi:hypothetical protein